MEEEICDKIVYIEFHDAAGPYPKIWLPENVSEDVLNHVSVKSISVLGGEQGALPAGLVILPFASLNLKGIMKFFQRNDKTFRGGIARTCITVLFNEEYDVIFYKYLEKFETAFDEPIKKIQELEEKKAKKEDFVDQLLILKNNLKSLLSQLKIKEIPPSASNAFLPESTEKDAEYCYKVIFCGDPEVGKTSTILRFTDKAFSNNYFPTLGVNILEKGLNLKKGVQVQFVLWDIAGQIKFMRMRKHFYLGTDGVFIIFDITNLESFKSVSKWLQDIKEHLHHDFPGFLLGNKSDLKSARKISHSEAKKLAQELKLEYIETSAKTGENVDSAFLKMAEGLIKSGTKRNECN